MKCIIDLTFLSHCWKIENNPADINKPFNFSDFNDRHWCSCRLSCARWPKTNSNFKAKQESKSQGSTDRKVGHARANRDAQIWHKSTKNVGYRPTACKPNVTLSLSADSSEKNILPQRRAIRLSWMYCLTLLSRKKNASFSLPLDGGGLWRACAGETRGTALESGPTAPTPVAPVRRAGQTWWLSRFQRPAFFFPPCWDSLPP